jgi:Ca-activated chloride channel family protein
VNIPESFHFVRPLWLGAFVPLAAILWLLARRRLRSRGWEAVCDPALLPHVLIGRSGPARRQPLLLAAAAGALAVLALAGPAWERLPQPVYSGGGALVIGLDLSRSMDAGDLPPSRLVRARYRVADILARRREGQTALLAYAGDAFTVTPLTDDVETIRSQLSALSTDIMPVAGSRGDKAMQLAGDLLRQAGLNQGQVLLVTDGIDAARGVEAARRLRGEGFSVSVLGVGTEQGAPVPLPDGGFLKNGSGEIVIPGLQEDSLEAVAAAGGGNYARLAIDDSDLATLAAVIAGKPQLEESSRTEFRADVWREEGPWLVLLLLPLAAYAFRRGYVLLIPLLLVLPPRPAAALGWDDLWFRPDQQGQRALESGNPGRAAELFGDAERKGAAQYRAGEFDAAADTLSGADGADPLYNRGNALARLGRYDEAIAAYAEALRRDPAHEDARYNRELLEKQRQEQQRQQQSGAGQSAEDQRSGEQDGQRQEDQSGADRGEDDRAESGEPAGGADSPSRADAAQSGAARRGDAGTPGERQPERSQGTGESRQNEKEPAAGKSQDQDPSAEKPSPEAGERRPAGGGEPGVKERGAMSAAADDNPPDEEQLAAEQWLRRIPDDPGGLLRRKFRYQYQQRAREPEPEEQAW